MTLETALTVLRDAVPGEAWVVGGALRDELLGRAVLDVDVALPGDPAGAAAAVADRVPVFRFPLSEGFGGWRVVDRSRVWQIDLLPLQGPDLAADLAARDLTINALARPLAGGEIIDPTGGRADLGARRLRMVGPDAFAADPLRVLRLARLSAELEFDIDSATGAAAAQAAPGLTAVAAERVLAEFLRLLCLPRALDGLAAMERLAATPAVLPELAALGGVEQSQYHHLDVGAHTRQVLTETIALTQRPEDRLGSLAGRLRPVLDEPLANELTRGQALRLGALFHDMAKPQTRAVSDAGRVTFFDHDRQGAELAAAVLRRLRASEALVSFVSALVRHHLRAGFLVHERPLSRRAIYEYLRSTEPVEVEVTLLSIADRLATRGRNAEAAIAGHLEVAEALLAEALAWRADRPRPPVRGDELARVLQLPPGPEIGRLLGALEAAAFAGEIEGPEAAIELARRLTASAASTES